MSFGVGLVVAFAALAASAPAPASYPPEGVRLALGATPDIMAVAWSTMENTSSPVTKTHVEWGLFGQALNNSAVGKEFLFFSNAQYDGNKYNFTTHAVNMTGLLPNTKYSYRVGDPDAGWSKKFYFTTQPTPETQAAHLPDVHILYGDMGTEFAYSLCENCDKSAVCNCDGATKGVVSEINDASLVLHVGDFAYDLDTLGGRIGDQFFRNVEPVSAYLPYMVSIGNHEDSDTTIAQFVERYRHMPSNSGTISSVNGVAPNNMYFSWDAGLVHYVSISTEIQANVLGADMVRKQFEWLEADLKKANANRHNVPWILVNGHRSMYCSCDGDCNQEAEQQREGPWVNGTYGFEQLFFDQGVDLFINGHEHNYERNWPTYKDKTDQSNLEPKATIYIVTGSAGCRELHEPFRMKQPPRSAYRSNTFGYSKMIVHNATHMRWQQIRTDPTFFPKSKYGEIIDDTWFIQHNHGPFSLENAPKHKPTKVLGREFDHWVGTGHPKGEIVLPHGHTWRHDKDTVVRYPGFVKEFGSAVWEDMHKSQLDRGTEGH
eukprot:m.486118 g.486118  ORF g.486118 m.486118 type:complete len:545 (+) comp24185_c0_seq1:153-1787(+)